MVVKKLFHKETGKEEYVLVSIKTGKPLKWFGTKKPTDDEIAKEEQRIEYFRSMRKKHDNK
jgi:hypothetical protein